MFLNRFDLIFDFKGLGSFTFQNIDWKRVCSSLSKWIWGQSYGGIWIIHRYFMQLDKIPFFLVFFSYSHFIIKGVFFLFGLGHILLGNFHSHLRIWALLGTLRERLRRTVRNWTCLARRVFLLWKLNFPTCCSFPVSRIGTAHVIFLQNIYNSTITFNVTSTWNIIIPDKSSFLCFYVFCKFILCEMIVNG